MPLCANGKARPMAADTRIGVRPDSCDFAALSPLTLVSTTAPGQKQQAASTPSTAAAAATTTPRPFLLYSFMCRTDVSIEQTFSPIGISTPPSRHKEERATSTQSPDDVARNAE
ncbi:unnamed protein product [Scytosiphon promiscuus]